MKRQALIAGPSFLLAVALVTGCSVKDAGTESADSTTTGSSTAGGLSGRISINGSSTVFPISQAAAEEFHKKHTGVHVDVAMKGTGGGFKAFIRGETDINDASRPIKQKEIDGCKKAGIEYLELKIAIDGLSVVVNPENDWCDCLTVEQLKAIWEPGSKVNNWKQVNPAWPDEKIVLYGPDTDSGTFDYFTEVICGEGGASRSDYTPSVDDNVLVRGVGGDKGSLGYFGYAYYAENKDKLKVLGVAAGSDPKACVKPTDATIEGGKYVPLSRPLFLYVNKASLKKSEVAAFLKFYLQEGQDLVGEVGYVRLSQSVIGETRQALEDAAGQ